MCRAAPSIALLGLLLPGLAACSGLEDSVRDLNRSLYRTWAGDPRAERPDAVGGGEYTPCFNAGSGLLYMSQTGRCAPGYVPVPIEQATQAYRGSGNERTASRTVEPETAVAAQSQSVAQALCYDERQGQVFGAASCPPGSRWVSTAEAASLQQAQLEGASWCYFASRRVLYRSRACRPGDQALDIAQADRLWTTLPADRRPNQRPSETAGGAQPVPPVQASPRGGVSATPLPSRQ